RYFYVVSEPASGQQKETAKLQLQGWFELVKTETETQAIADWIVGDKLAPKPGEYVYSTVKAEVPRWSTKEERFILMIDPKANFGNREKVPIPFGSGSDGPVLVDVEGGAIQPPAPGRIKAEKDVAVEMLLLTPDGKLIAHDSWSDRDDPGRQDRLAAYN